MKRQTVVKMICETGISRELLDSEEVRKIAEEWNFPLPLSALLFLNRGYRTKEEITAFLYPSVGELPSPFLLKDMDKAVARILPALEGKEKILIYGDYDADGITATALLWSYLKSKGVTADCRIPDRFSEGYGIREEALSEAKDRGIQLILTVDTGITACKELSKASSLGLDVVVTDHHECKSTLPECCAVVNPMRPDCSYPFKGLAGVGVAYKLISALECRLTDEDEKTVNERLLSQYGDFLTLGTVADVMPLTKENRIYVKEGLKLLDTGVHPGLSALLRLAQGEKRMKSACTVTTVGYMLAPRINAAGRMGSAESALRLLQTESPSEGEALGQFLCSCNLQRQLEEAKIYKEAEELLHSDESYKNDRILLLWKEGWHQGVIGIVASRIAERYGKPTILVSLEGEEGKGSGRSPEGCNLVELLKENEGLLLRYGGHELAAGLSVKRELLPTLRLALNALKAGKTVGTEKVFKAELELKPAEMTLRLASALSALEPCGNGNEAPVFLLRGRRNLRNSAPFGRKTHQTDSGKRGVALCGITFRTAHSTPALQRRREAGPAFQPVCERIQGSRQCSAAYKECGPCGVFQEKREKRKRKNFSLFVGKMASLLKAVFRTVWILPAYIAFLYSRTDRKGTPCL